MEENYEKILGRISRSSGLSKEELGEKVEAKRTKLSGLISKEGALQVIAAELGISFDEEKLKINELLPGMRKVNLIAQIVSLSPVRTFTNKNGDQGKVANLFIADDTSNIKVVLWDTNHIELIEKEQLKENSVIEIAGGSMRDNEIHLGSFSELKPSKEILSDLKTEKQIKEKEICELSIGDYAKLRAFIVQAFEPKFFEINKATGRKITDEERAAGAQPEKRMLMTVVLDDGFETIRAVLFSEVLKKVGVFELEDLNLLNQQRENVLGKELFLIGNVRRNSYFNNQELILDDVEEIDLDKLVVELEK